MFHTLWHLKCRENWQEITWKHSVVFKKSRNYLLLDAKHLKLKTIAINLPAQFNPLPMKPELHVHVNECLSQKLKTFLLKIICQISHVILNIRTLRSFCTRRNFACRAESLCVLMPERAKATRYSTSCKKFCKVENDLQ